MASTSSSSTVQLAEYSYSGVNVSNFVTTKLQFGEDSNMNYATWKEQMLCLLESQGLLGFVNGELAAEEQGKMKSEDDVVWRRKERLVKGWILGAISDELVRRCVQVDSARDVWLLLEKIYNQLKKGEAPPQPSTGTDQGNYGKYLKLYKAALRGDWDTASGILKQDLNAHTARVTVTLETALHVAVGTGVALQFVKNLLLKMSGDDLKIKDRLGRTALHIAALTGNTAAARLLVDKVPDLLYEPAGNGLFPIHAAARTAHRETLEFLLSQTRGNSDNNLYGGPDGVLLLCLVIDADFYDIALRLVGKHPGLAGMKHGGYNISALETLSLREAAFFSGARFESRKERLIYLLQRAKVKRELLEAKSYIVNATSFSVQLDGSNYF